MFWRAHTWLISIRPLSVSMSFCNQGVEQSVSYRTAHMEVVSTGFGVGRAIGEDVVRVVSIDAATANSE